MTIIVFHGFADASKLEAAAMYTVPFHASVAHNSPTGRNENLDRKRVGAKRTRTKVQKFIAKYVFDCYEKRRSLVV